MSVSFLLFFGRVKETSEIDIAHALRILFDIFAVEEAYSHLEIF